MTTGGPDTADVYELTLKDGDPTQYEYDGQWRSMERREVTLKVRGEKDQKHRIWLSHHGPIIALREGKAYAATMAYADLATTFNAWYELNYAKDYRGAIAAMETLSLFPQNVMVADTSGNIYYQRTGRVPKRPAGYDWSRPVDGSTSKTEWQGVHPASDHLQVLNPSQGYMQNCNIPPDAMMPNSPFSLDEHLKYLYSDASYGPARAGWTNQRGARAIELLEADDSVTAEEAMAIINDVKPYGVERWLDVLGRAHEVYGQELRDDPLYTAAVEDLLAWDSLLTRDSTGALKYTYWREAIAESRELNEALENGIDDWYAIVEGRAPKSINISDAQLEGAAKAFARAMANLHGDWGTLNAAYGDRFRVGRDGTSWPVGGGEATGTSTLRNIRYDSQKDDGTSWGSFGQTATQVVVLSRPIKSWTYLPIGQSDRPGSKHYRDQAKLLFSKRKMKPTWWMPEDLKAHIESTTYLDVILDD
jgi:acyl-homoserine-lactone acylase